MGPSLALPSISEDDENLPEVDAIVTLSPHLTNLSRSPIHTSSPPRHAKILHRYCEIISGFNNLKVNCLF